MTTSPIDIAKEEIERRVLEECILEQVVPTIQEFRNRYAVILAEWRQKNIRHIGAYGFASIFVLEREIASFDLLLSEETPRKDSAGSIDELVIKQQVRMKTERILLDLQYIISKERKRGNTKLLGMLNDLHESIGDMPSSLTLAN